MFCLILFSCFLRKNVQKRTKMRKGQRNCSGCLIFSFFLFLFRSHPQLNSCPICRQSLRDERRVARNLGLEALAVTLHRHRDRDDGGAGGAQQGDPLNAAGEKSGRVAKKNRPA